MTKQNILSLAQLVAATEHDFNIAHSAEVAPPAVGLARLRFVAYVEVGQKHDERYNKNPDRAWFVFELSGPKHKPRTLDSGEIIPYRITVKTSKGANEKSNYFRLFKAMNWEGKATHPAQLLGSPYIGRVEHATFKQNGKDITYATLRDDVGYTIRKPIREDMETGEEIVVPVDEPISELRLFTWNAPEEAIKPMWESIYIQQAPNSDRDTNVYQNEIRAADNFIGSPIHKYLVSIGEDETPPVETPQRLVKTKPAEDEDEDEAPVAKTRAPIRVDELEEAIDQTMEKRKAQAANPAATVRKPSSKAVSMEDLEEITGKTPAKASKGAPAKKDDLALLVGELGDTISRDD